MRNPSVITNNTDYCYLCGRPGNGVHHLLFGKHRQLADEDGIYFGICDYCHTMGKHRIHDNPTAEKLSKMLGQAYWILDHVDYTDVEEAKKKFMERYGENYL